MKFERAYWAVLALTVIQFCYWMHQFGPHIPALVDYAARILNGHPDWRALQNRVLGPFILIYWFGWLPAPLPIFTAVFLGLCNFLFYRVAREITGGPITSLLCLAVYILVWLFLFSKLSFTFDLIEMSVLIWFFRAAVLKPGAGIFDATVIYLFLIQLLNRESALFLAAYLGLCGVLRLILNDGRRLAWREFAWGGGLFVAGAALIEYVRKKFFIMGPIARAGADLKHRHFENFIIYHKNMVFYFVDLHGGWKLAKAPVFLVFLVATHLLITLVGLVRKRASVAAYGAAMTLYSAAIFFTAELEETRVMQILVPPVVLAVAWIVVHTVWYIRTKIKQVFRFREVFFLKKEAKTFDS